MKSLLLATLTVFGACHASPTLIAAESEIDFGAAGPATEVVRPGAVVWMDLLTGDVARAASFYGKVFGWSFRFSPDGRYAYGTLNGVPVASIAAYENEMEKADGLWIPSISVADVDKAMTAVKTYGGSLVGPPGNLQGRGRYQLVEDPTGAAVMLLRAEGGDPARSESPNQWLWTELWTDGTGKAAGFYKKVVGYGTVDLKDTEGQTITVMGRDQQPHASMIKTPLPDMGGLDF